LVNKEHIVALDKKFIESYEKDVVKSTSIWAGVTIESRRAKCIDLIDKWIKRVQEGTTDDKNHKIRFSKTKNGKLHCSLYYGTKALDWTRGKKTIVVASGVDEVEFWQDVIREINAGGFDSQIESAASSMTANIEKARKAKAEKAKSKSK
jgi:hypothetical protein